MVITSHIWSVIMKTKRIYMELVTDADLSEASLETARRMIINNNLKNSKYSNFDYYVLRISSQSLGIAVYLMNYIGATMEISPTYSEDEWSLEERSYVDKEVRVTIVHSNGA